MEKSDVWPPLTTPVAYVTKVKDCQRVCYISTKAVGLDFRMPTWSYLCDPSSP